MLKNIYLFTGQETYLLDKELLRRKENFLAKYGPDSVFSFSLERLDIAQLKQVIYSSGLFTIKKLILINGLPLDATTKIGEEISEQLTTFVDTLIKAEGKIPDDSLLVFVSPTPDKRLKLYKFLEKYAQVKEFNQLKGNDLIEFVQKELHEFSIDRSLILYFLNKVGSDLYRIWFECDKLKTWAHLRQATVIDQSMIDMVVFGQVETDSFVLLDALFDNSASALRIVEKISEAGAERNQFAGMLYRALKFYLFMIDLENNGITQSKDIATLLKMNPWQVSTSYKKIGILKAYKKNIVQFYIDLVELDFAIKTGKYPDTYFWLGIKKMIAKFVQ